MYSSTQQHVPMTIRLNSSASATSTCCSAIAFYVSLDKMRRGSNRICCKQEGGGFGNQVFLVSFFCLVLVSGLIAAVVINVNIGNYEKVIDEELKNVTNGNLSVLIPVLNDETDKDGFGCFETEVHFSIGQYYVLKVVGLVSASLSTAGSFFILLTWLLFPTLRTFPFKLIAFLSASDFLASIAYILSFGESAEHCNKQDQCAVLGFSLHFFLCASFMWIFAISCNMNLVLVQRVGNDILQYEKYYHILTWGTCIVLSVTPLFFNAYGDAGNYCWIKTEHERYLGTFVYYIPLLLVMVMSSVNFFLSLLKMKAGQDRKTTGEVVRVKIRLALYVAVFLLFHFFEITKKIHVLLDPRNPSFGLYFLTRIFSPLIGLANAVVYGWNKAVISRYRAACCTNRGSNLPDTIKVGTKFDNISAAESQNQEPDALPPSFKGGRNSWSQSKP